MAATLVLPRGAPGLVGVGHGRGDLGELVVVLLRDARAEAEDEVGRRGGDRRRRGCPPSRRSASISAASAPSFVDLGVEPVGRAVGVAAPGDLRGTDGHDAERGDDVGVGPADGGDPGRGLLDRRLAVGVRDGRPGRRRRRPWTDRRPRSDVPRRGAGRAGGEDEGGGGERRRRRAAGDGMARWAPVESGDPYLGQAHLISTPSRQPPRWIRSQLRRNPSGPTRRPRRITRRRRGDQVTPGPTRPVAARACRRVWSSERR